MESLGPCIFSWPKRRLFPCAGEQPISCLARDCATKSGAFLPAVDRSRGNEDAGRARSASYGNVFDLIIRPCSREGILSIKLQRLAESEL